MDHRLDSDAISGMAALSICESLLIALSDLRIMGSAEASGVLQDAAAAHRNASTIGPEGAIHLSVAVMIERVIAGRKALLQP
jgi:hypothetical protein